MRSYYSHLQATQSVGETIDLKRKPVFRSSAIFPVLHNSQYSSKVIFMGYWLLKRHIREIGLLYTLRNQPGEVVGRKYLCVNSAKAYSIQLNEFADLIGDDFTGSLELEIFSTQDLIFPYPAFVLVYYSDTFSTAVHTVGRVYNDIEDLRQNETYQARESGFDIYGSDTLSPFVGFTNGPIANDNPTLTYQVIDQQGKLFDGTFTLAPLAAFETRFLELKDHLPLHDWLGDAAGTIKLGHNFEGFFPRFTVGNFDTRTASISITHSYYDCSPFSDVQSYWNRLDEAFHDASVLVPLYITDGRYTRLVVYPTFSPSNFRLTFDFFDNDGHLLNSASDYQLVASDDNLYQPLDLGTIAESLQIDPHAATLVSVYANWDDKSRIPTRLKFGLNVGYQNRPAELPSNVCFAPSLGNPNVLKKGGTFRWAPFVNVGESEIAFTNGSPLKHYDRPATVQLTFHREADNEVLTRTLFIPANGQRRLALAEDSELAAFFGGASGWVAAQADNPYVNGFYFDFHANGAVAADHVF
ncbi:hypothetical protein ACFSUS_04770 [Spirosoma soli]|uniref:DUF2961 domain-containing protein n=1 Tax=Spirosoma soli TaxID=1770529 RepID=A0ABW5LZ24_9BACT